MALAEQVGDKDFSLMPDDRGASIQFQYKCTFGVLCRLVISAKRLWKVTPTLICFRLLCWCMVTLLQEILICSLVKDTLTCGRKGRQITKPVNSLSPQAELQLPLLLFLATLVTGMRPLEGEWETYLVLLFQEHELNSEYVSSYIIKDAPVWTGTNQPMAAMSQWRVCTPPSLFNWKISHHPTISWNKLKYKSKLKHCMC